MTVLNGKLTDSVAPVQDDLQVNKQKEWIIYFAVF